MSQVYVYGGGLVIGFVFGVIYGYKKVHAIIDTVETHNKATLQKIDGVIKAVKK